MDQAHAQEASHGRAALQCRLIETHSQLARGLTLDRLKSVIVERSMNEQWLSNTYLVADELGSQAAMIDAGGPVDPLLDVLRRMRFELTHVLLTHHHHDHIAELDRVLERHPQARVLIHPLERDHVPAASGTLSPGEAVECGALHIEPLHTPGHTAGMISLIVNGTDVFTGDTLFKGSVGGVRAPGHTTYADLKQSIMDKLLKLPPETRIHPGHSDPTTVADELEGNPFVRLWRGLDREGDEPCTALGQPATLVLMATDYDGGAKAWVRWEDGSDDIVPGSQVQRTNSSRPEGTDSEGSPGSQAERSG
jgi:glyoxylase-like metal-dependent hydrolase (beta-lactamase superfamily II)